MRSRVLLIIIVAAALTVAANTARAQDHVLQGPYVSSEVSDQMMYTEIEPDRPRDVSRFGFERGGNHSRLAIGGLEFGHSRDRNSPLDGRSTRFEQVYLSNSEHWRVQPTIWRSGDRQDFHGGTKHKAVGIGLSVVF